MGLGRSHLFVGRSVEVDALRRAADEARGGHAEVLIIEGEPGIGKTRLAAQLPDTILSAEDIVLRGHGLQLAGGEIPYGVAAELVRDAAQRLGVEELRDRVGGHAAHLAVLYPALEGAVPGAAVDRAALFAAFHDLLGSLSGEHLVCILVDDLQWVDASSRELLTYLAKVFSQARVLMVCTVRTSRSDVDPIARELTELVRAEHSQTLVLRPMEPDEVREQAFALLGAEPTPALLGQLQQRCDGVPLFVEELLAAGGDLTTTLRLNLVDRLAGLSPDAERYLDAAAVAEGHAYPALVSRVTGQAFAAADRGRDELLRNGLLETATDIRDRFHHALLRDAVLGRMTRATRQGWHRTWAQELAADPGPLPAGTRTTVLAAHWYASGDRTPEALVAVVEAARLATLRAGLVEAVLWWERTLELWPSDLPAAEPVPDVGLSRDAVFMRTLRSFDALYDPRVIDLIDAEMARDPRAPWSKRLYMRFQHASYTENSSGRHAPGAPPGEVPELVTRLLSEPPDEFTVWCLVIMSVDYSAVLQPDVIDSAVAVFEEYARADGDRRTVARLLAWRGYVETVRGNADATVAVFEEWDRLFDPGSEARAADLIHFLWNLAFVGEYRRAAVAVPEHVLASTDASVVDFWRDVIEGTAWLRFVLGDWDGAVELIERGVALIGSSETVIADAVLARITANRGRFDLAEQHLATAHARVPPDEVGCPLSWSREVPLAEVDVHLARGDLDRAWAVVARLLSAPLHGHGIEVDRESVLMGARILAAMSDRPSGAEELVLGAMDRVVPLDRLDAAWRREVQLRLGSSSDPDQWRDVVAAWDRIGHAHHGCVARAALATALLTSRQREEATEVLASALTVAEELGAAPLLGRLRSIAATARLPVGSASQGHLPREARRLTEREFEVLELVAAGRSNHDIADELFISHKTASVHVSHIIAKLEVSNRTEAAAYAHQNGILPPPAP